MPPTFIFVSLLLLSTAAYWFGRRRAFSAAGGGEKIRDLHSRPTYYGALTALWSAIPALLVQHADVPQAHPPGAAPLRG